MKAEPKRTKRRWKNERQSAGKFYGKWFKKGLPTTYFLTVADEPIDAHAELRHVDFVPLNNVNAFNLGNPLAGLIPGGTVFKDWEDLR